ncbi:MAG TPA: roadblock/LC7 domain-containing protein [Methylomirabilota bacterium]|jgi:predicted regulator of Ras-like GTPase activity (Roadblock/LC7/MglB family)|nr:roadblock/LC7 domain-containing protein [Methylomirabilota bacterium]
MSPEARTVSTTPERISRAAAVRSILGNLARIPGVRGGLLIASDGFVIASSLPQEVPLDPLAALATTLGRELELGTGKLNRGMVSIAFFSADDGSVFLGPSPMGFVLLLAERHADVSAMRGEFRKALDTLQAAWRAGDHTGGRL